MSGREAYIAQEQLSAAGATSFTVLERIGSRNCGSSLTACKETKDIGLRFWWSTPYHFLGDHWYQVWTTGEVVAVLSEIHMRTEQKEAAANA